MPQQLRGRPAQTARARSVRRNSFVSRDTLTLGGSLDMQFETLNLAFDENLFFAPVGDQPEAILDVGTGTGEILSSSCHEQASEY